MRMSLFVSLGLCMAASLPLSGAHAIRRPLTLRVYDIYSVSHRQLDTARSITRKILGNAGFDATWRPCSRAEGSRSWSDCKDPIQRSELIVRIVAAPIGSDASNGSLGYSVVDPQARMGTFATVFGDRVKVLADAAGLEPGTVLGRAIAHELGHLLMGNTGHGAEGLMQGTWSVVALKRNPMWQWFFSPLEAHQMRRGLDARLQAAPHLLATLTNPDDPIVDSSK
jgi:hypothetical protein